MFQSPVGQIKLIKLLSAFVSEEEFYFISYFTPIQEHIHLFSILRSRVTENELYDDQIDIHT